MKPIRTVCVRTTCIFWGGVAVGGTLSECNASDSYDIA
jgi:hypothetical protein